MPRALAARLLIPSANPQGLPDLLGFEPPDLVEQGIPGGAGVRPRRFPRGRGGMWEITEDVPFPKTTALSMTFSSSRTLPGKAWATRAFRASRGDPLDLLAFPVLRIFS